MRIAKILCVVLALYCNSISASALETFKIDIGPMSCHDALISLASQTSYDIIFDEGAIPQFEFEGKSGTFSITEVLGLLLNFSGFTYSVNGRQIRIARNDIKTFVLPKVTVRGYLRDATARVMQNADDQSQFPLHQLPLSIQSVTEKHIDDVEARDIDEVLSYVSGIEYFALSSGVYPQFYSRGIPALFSVDGKFYRRTLLELDPSVLERVDVVQGPSANYIQPGGMVNFVTKKPLRDPKYSVLLKAGSEDYYRTELDINIAEDSEFNRAFRVVGAAEKSKSFKDHVFKERYVVSPSIDFEFSDKTQMLISVYHQLVNRFPYTFTFHPSIAGGEVPRNQTTATPWSTSSTRDSTFGLDFSHQSDGGWLFGLGGNMSFAKIDVLSGALRPSSSGVPGEARFSTGYTDGAVVKSSGVDSTIEKSYSLFGIDALSRISMEYQEFENIVSGYSYRVIPDVFNVLDTDHYSVDPQSLTDTGEFHQKNIFSGASVSQSIFVNEGFALHFDVRYEDMRIQSQQTEIDRELSSPVYSYKKLARNYSEVTPRLGVNATFSDNFSGHISYSESFTSQTSLLFTSFTNDFTSAVDLSPPVKARQWEGALKNSWFEDQFVGSVTLYDISISRIRIYSPGGEEVFDNTLADNQYSRGVELSVSGDFSDRLNFLVNVNYNDNSVNVRDWSGIDSGYGFVGSNGGGDRRLYSSAKNVGNLWVDYDFGAGYEGGVGVKYVGERNVDDATDLKLSSYTKSDIFLKYNGFSDTTLSLTVRNAFNKKYFRSSWGQGDYIEEGEPVGVFLSVKTTRGF